MAIYLKYKDIVGDVDESTHVKWIELTSVQWSATRPVSKPAGSASLREVMAPQVSELTVSKDQDVASIPLVQEALSGEPGDARIDFVRTGTSEIETYYSIVLKGALISAFSQSSGGSRPTESLTLNFTGITVTGSQMAHDGTGETPASYAWNVASGAPM